MDIKQMRELIMGAYPGGKWKKRVEAMSDDQVVSVYNRLKSEGKI